MPPRTVKMGRPKKAAAMRTMIIGPEAAALRGRRNAPAAARAGAGTVPPAVTSWTRGSKPKKRPRTTAASPAQSLASFFPIPVMKRTLMARKPAAMIMTTARFGRNPTRSDAAKAFTANDSALVPKASVSPDARAAVTASAGPFRRAGRNIPVARARCLFSRDVIAPAMKVAASTRCST